MRYCQRYKFSIISSEKFIKLTDDFIGAQTKLKMINSSINSNRVRFQSSGFNYFIILDKIYCPQITGSINLIIPLPADSVYDALLIIIHNLSEFTTFSQRKIIMYTEIHL